MQDAAKNNHLKVVIFFYICIMGKYLVWVLHFYDEAIEENNVAGNCLSRKCAEEQEKHGSWIHDRYIYNKEGILGDVWDKEDVNEFVKENPESISWTFLIFKDNYRWKKGEKNYYEYCPLKEQRDKKLKKLL